jgi:hypothetical protein
MFCAGAADGWLAAGEVDAGEAFVGVVRVEAGAAASCE